ncbi:hypothetical protein HPB51_020555 [Rhipicephalus microplus]|uniref:Regulatory protein zeste n=1 Tax=Rhipicephalus microplus TaxID=6941 RepID=A0A9J6DW93_RHIMP|nr:hypothetical protein HPB51_020555 [Rhipicephalus microplus]
MAYCCVPKCKSDAKRKVPGISFHEIPSDSEARAAWLKAIARKDWMPNTTSRYSVVCSRHFLLTDYKEGCKTRKLKRSATPSVFDDYPEYMQPKPKKPRSDAAARQRALATDNAAARPLKTRTATGLFVGADEDTVPVDGLTSSFSSPGLAEVPCFTVPLQVEVDAPFEPTSKHEATQTSNVVNSSSHGSDALKVTSKQKKVQASQFPVEARKLLEDLLRSPASLLPTVDTAALAMVGGFVARVIQEKIACSPCISVVTKPASSAPIDSLIRHQDRGRPPQLRFVFSREERELLVNLATRHKAVIENKRTDALTERAKDSVWEKLTSEYNSQPGIRRVTLAQLRKLWDTEKSKWKKKQSEEKRNLYATVVAPGNDESRTVAAAPEENGKNLAGAGERQRPKSTRSRLAAIERVLAPEATARMEALKTDEKRKAQLHALELRLRKQQLFYQRKMNRMQVQREQELHKMQVQLLEQQLKQQKWRFNIERQKLFELQEKQQQQRIETQPEQK